MHFVRKINSIDGYKISITFDDKKTKIVDTEPYLKKGVFLPLRDPEYFRLVKVKYDTLVWPNEADFCPDTLYEIGTEVHEKKKPTRHLSKARSRFKHQATTYAMTKRLPKKTKS